MSDGAASRPVPSASRPVPSASHAPPSGSRPALSASHPVSSASRSSSPRGSSPSPARPARGWPLPPARLVPLARLLVLAAGWVSVLSGLLPADRDRLAVVVRLLGLPAASAAAASSVVLGVVLVLLARGLRRRQRRAWAVAVPLLTAGAAVHLLKGLDVEEATLCLLAAGVLAATRREFAADPDPVERAHPLLLAAGLAVLSVLAGLLALRWNAASLVGSKGLGAQVSTVLHGLVGLSGPLLLRDDRAADLVGSILDALGLLTVALPLAVALRTPRGRAGLDPAELDEVRALAARRADSDSLDYFALRADKDAVFSPSRKAAVSYRVEAGVALATGDPLGDPEAWPGAVRAFLDLTDAHGWAPAVLGCSERGGTAWTRSGLAALELGDEAVVDPATFSLEGRAMRGVRQAVHRVRRAGVTTTVRRLGDLEDDELAGLRAAATGWRDGPVERGFSMALGRLGGPGDERCVVATATKDGQLQALLHFVPWGPDGLSLDLMRRSRGSDNGVNELLIVAALEAAPGLGVRRVSLNFAVFRAALEQGARLGAGPVVRTWRRLLLEASRVWQIDSLYRFNNKFAPTWQPRYLCYRRPSDLPRVALAALQAEAFLPRPRLPFTLPRFVSPAAGGARTPRRGTAVERNSEGTATRR